MDKTLLKMRIVHGAMLLAAVIYILLAEGLNAGRAPRNVTVLYRVMSAQVILVIAIAFFVRQRFVSRSAELLRADPNDTTAQMRWRSGNVLFFAFAESIMLFGLVLRFIGASRLQAIPYYAVSIVMFLLFYPQEP